MKKALFTITIIAMFAGVLAAQSKGIGDGKGMFTSGVSLTGMQITPGTYDDIDKRVWGNTFVLNGSGEWFSVHMTVTMDYNEGIPSFKDGNAIALGNWSMVIYRDNVYFGTVYGDFTEGEINWILNPKTGDLEKRETGAVLRMLGSVDGMQKFENYNMPITFKAETILNTKNAVTIAVLNAEF
jgi:hypothetical protein